MTWIEDAQRRDWAAWLAERPARVRAVAESLPPWNRYRMASTGHVVEVRSFDEPEDESAPVTVTVIVLRRNNPDMVLFFERHVFGVKPEDLYAIEEPGRG